MPRFTELSLSAQTAYAQLFEAALGAELTRTVAHLRGSFSKKSVKGRDYWYFQYTDLNRTLRQLYVGPDSEPVRTLVEAARREKEVPLAKLARAAAALGCAPLMPRHYRVIRRLAEYGFFRAGGVLIGTHAFLLYGNIFGVHWGESARTQDVDLAHAGKNVAIALPSNLQVDTQGAIESLQMGLLPIRDLAGKSAATYLNPDDPEFRIDFLTTLHRGKDEPFKHPQLGVTLQPLKFLEYLLEQVGQAAPFAAEGAVVLNVPHPARYALHKLLVYGERSASFVQKSQKDLWQAAALLEYLQVQRPWEVEESWQDLVARGPGWQRRARQGISALDRLAPQLEVKAWLRFPSAS